ncbi:MAG TPA: enoyl-CoA hydratase/isomerase family protein [Actinomycetota bacterium]|nr:enoyl-CoA hydratase/isomerase family protein [Actinomycetota bacterium]
MGDGLRLDRVGHTLTAMIDTGEGNLFSREMMDDLVDSVREAGRDDAMRFVHLRAEGDDFCLGREKGGATPDELRAMAGRIATVNEALRTTPLTVVAEVNGPAAGYGVGMIGASDIAVAADTATFAFPEIKAGFAPAVVISWARFQLPPRLLYDMVSTGDAIDAAAALAAGLVTEVVPRTALPARVAERLERLSSVDAFALREMKRFLVFTRAMDPQTAAHASTDTLVFSGLRVIGRF